ncbi:MAG: LptA/OstA family protein, partial [Stellaceae bacterium]
MSLRFAVVLLVAAVGAGVTPSCALAQLAGAQASNRPIHIEADNGIEWQQAHSVYIARGNASATRGNATVTADILYAYYRPVGQAADHPAKPAAATSTDVLRTQNPLPGGSSTEIYRIEAQGHVHFVNGDQQAFGDHAVYDVDEAVMVLTGNDLRVVTPDETITARDSLEWYDKRQIAVARGNALMIRGDRRMRADIVTADVEKQGDQPAQITRVNGYGNVLISAPGQIAHGDEGVYNVGSQVATLVGNVRLTKGDNELHGEYGVVDLKNNVSQILAAPPNQIATGPT